MHATIVHQYVPNSANASLNIRSPNPVIDNGEIVHKLLSYVITD